MKKILWIIIVSLIVVCYNLGGKELLFVAGGLIVVIIIGRIPSFIREIEEEEDEIDM